MDAAAAHPELSVEGDDGVEDDHEERPPEVGVVPHHVPLEAGLGQRQQHAAQLVEDVAHVYVQLLPADRAATPDEGHSHSTKARHPPTVHNGASAKFHTELSRNENLKRWS